MEKPLVPLMCGDCKRPVMDHTVAIELCSECDELRCGDCASVVSGRFVCWACQPRLAARLETRRAAGAAPSRTASTPTFAHSPPGPKSPKPGLLDRFLASASGSDEQARREREAKRVLRAKLEREERMRECGRTWKEEVIPHWVKTATSRKVRDLCWQGIPPSLRKDVWPLLIGNRLSISPELFEIHGGRAFEVRNLSSTGQLNLAESDQHSNKEQSVLLIPVDIGRTFPLLGFFQEEGPQHEELRHVLEAYVCLRPDIGYVQGDESRRRRAHVCVCVCVIHSSSILLRHVFHRRRFSAQHGLLHVVSVFSKRAEPQDLPRILPDEHDSDPQVHAGAGGAHGQASAQDCQAL